MYTFVYVFSISLVNSGYQLGQAISSDVVSGILHSSGSSSMISANSRNSIGQNYENVVQIGEVRIEGEKAASIIAALRAAINLS